MLSCHIFYDSRKQNTSSSYLSFASKGKHFAQNALSALQTLPQYFCCELHLCYSLRKPKQGWLLYRSLNLYIIEALTKEITLFS